MNKLKTPPERFTIFLKSGFFREPVRANITRQEVAEFIESTIKLGIIRLIHNDKIVVEDPDCGMLTYILEGNQ